MRCEMIHYIWSFLMLISLGFACFSGNLSLMTEAVMDGAKEAVNLCIVMAAVVGLWSGIMEIGVASGVIDKLSEMMSPFLKWMFPGLKKRSKALKYIASNFAANLLGLGWAATPAGLAAMEELAADQPAGQPARRSASLAAGRPVNQSANQPEEATDEMCTFVLLNVSSLQLIPLTIVVYRSQYGSGSPASIVVPGLIATAISTIVAVVFAKVMCRKSGKKQDR